MPDLSSDKPIIAEAVRATEAGAIAAARLMGRGDRDGADQAAVTAMRKAMDDADISGTIVIGEGERDEAPMLYIGEQVGNADGAMRVDIAVDPLEGTNLVANGEPNATAVLAAAEPGGLMHAPDTYLEKLIVGPSAAGKVDINDPVEKTLTTLAETLGRNVWDITVVILERPRHEQLISDVRAAGARIKLIGDGDLTAGINVAISGTGLHAVMGIGGAPEGVLAAAALKCLGGEIQAKFKWRSDEERERARDMGVDVDDSERVYFTDDLASGRNVVFCATGVTDGELLQGVRFFGGGARTHSLVMGYQTKQVRFVDTVHMFDRDKPPAVRL
jgi:fructose-1,6-bisphosphatase II